MGILGDEAVYLGLLEVSNTLCGCTNGWERVSGREIFYFAAFVVEVSFSFASIYLAFTGQLHSSTCGNIGDRRGI